MSPIAAYAFALLLSLPATAQDGLPEQLHRFLSAQESEGFSGSVLVRHDGEVVLERGYGLAHRRDRIGNTKETVFDVASLTKLVTATAVLQLAVAGKLSTEDPLTRFFPQVPADKRTITIHHLLTHSSGLPTYHDTQGDFQEMWRSEALRRILSAELRFPPGSECGYSNSGYTLLAMIVEEVSGKTYRTYVEEMIFRPAGMTRTGFYRDPRWTADTTASGNRGRQRRGSPADFPGPSWVLKGNAGLVTTPGDLDRFLAALEEGRLLPPEALATMRAPYILFRDDTHYARGFRVRQTARDTVEMRHGGGQDFGFSAYLRHFPEEQATIIVLANSTVDGRSPVIRVSQGLAEILFGEGEE